MITHTIGPEIADAYEIPLKDWVRLTHYEITQMKCRIANASRELNTEERREFNATLRNVLGLCACRTVSELYDASNLDQDVFFNTYNKLMGYNG